MANLLTDVGEEYLIKNGLDSGTSTWAVGLYNDSTDTIADTDEDPATDITTEPSGGSYARQSDNFSPSDLSGDWGSDNDSQLTYNTSDSSQTVDSWFLVINFNSSDASDTSPSDHIIATGALSQSRDLSQIDTLNLDAGGVGVTVS